MKIEYELDIDTSWVVKNILYFLINNYISMVDEDAIIDGIRRYIHITYDINRTCAISDLEMQKVKKEFIDYLNNLIKQLS